MILVPQPSLSPSVSVGAAGYSYVQRDSSGGRRHGAAQVAKRWVTLPGAVFSLTPCPVGSEYDAVAAVLGVSGIQSGSLGTAAHAWNMLRVRA